MISESIARIMVRCYAQFIAGQDNILDDFEGSHKNLNPFRRHSGAVRFTKWLESTFGITIDPQIIIDNKYDTDLYRTLAETIGEDTEMITPIVQIYEGKIQELEETLLYRERKLDKIRRKLEYLCEQIALIDCEEADDDDCYEDDCDY